MSGTAAVAERTGGSRETATGLPVPVRLASVYLPAPLPREGRLAFWDPEGDPLPTPPGGTIHELTVVRRHGAGVRRRQVPALTLPLAGALPLLVGARRDPAAHPATACWGAAALHALRLVARGRLLPGLTPDGHDAWRAGPLEPDDIAHLRAIAAALPPEGHAVPLPGPGALLLPEPEALVRSFLDAVADTLPRTPAAPHTCGRPFAAREPQSLPAAHEWAAEVAAGMDAGVRLSLRLDLSAYDVFDAGADDGTRAAGAAVVQVHSLADPTLVADAAALWAGEAAAAFG
ncbi:ATP-dependent helicase, partial [Streptomyces sp. SID486]|nr:ATP-dependent helicase [Streptomyces sp. SID486]